MSRATDAADVDTAWGTLNTEIQEWLLNSGTEPARVVQWILGSLCYTNAGCAHYIAEHFADHKRVAQVGLKTFASNDNS